MNIEEYIKENINHIDLTDMVQNVIQNLIIKDIERSIHDITDNKVKSLIEEQLTVILAGEITTNDGFGSKKIYKNFEELFKQTLKKRMDESYNLNDQMNRAVRDRVDRLFQDKAKEVKDKFIKELTK